MSGAPAARQRGGINPPAASWGSTRLFATEPGCQSEIEGASRTMLGLECRRAPIRMMRGQRFRCVLAGPACLRGRCDRKNGRRRRQGLSRAGKLLVMVVGGAWSGTYYVVAPRELVLRSNDAAVHVTVPSRGRGHGECSSDGRRVELDLLMATFRLHAGQLKDVPVKVRSRARDRRRWVAVVDPSLAQRRVDRAARGRAEARC